MQVLQFLTDKIAVLSAFLPVYMLCKTYVSIHKLCNLHKGEKSQKSSNFVRKFSGGKPADKADFLTFGNIFGTFCLTVKKVLRSPRDRVSVLRRTVPRQLFCAPPHCTATGLHFLAVTPVSISPLSPRQGGVLFLPYPPARRGRFLTFKPFAIRNFPRPATRISVKPSIRHLFPPHPAGGKGAQSPDKRPARYGFRSPPHCPATGLLFLPYPPPFPFPAVTPHGMVSSPHRLVLRQFFCSPQHFPPPPAGFPFHTATSVSISPLPPRQRFLFLPCPPRAEADFSLSSRSLYGTSPARQPVFPSNPQSDNFFHPTRRAGKRNGDVRDKQTAGRQFRERQRCRER